MIRGIIYLRTAPNGKRYVGQTINEHDREYDWQSKHCYSAGNCLIDKARAKYGHESFQYEILDEFISDDRNVVRSRLNELEIYYIQIYNSYFESGLGYNMTRGGSNRLEVLSKDHKQAISNSLKGKSPKNLSVIQQSEKTKQANRDRGNPVLVFTTSGEFIAEYHSTNAACLDLKLNRGSASKVLNGKQSHVKGYTIKLKEQNG